MKENLFIERIEKKPRNKITNQDTMTLLMYDIRNLLEQLVKDKNKEPASGWFRKIFK